MTSNLDVVLTEFRDIVDGIYGVYCDATSGFQKVRDEAIEDEKQALEQFRKIQKSNSRYSNVSFGGVGCSYPRWVPKEKQGKCTHLHQADSEVIKTRNVINGANYFYMANMCVVSIYQYWEDHYRGILAQLLKLEGQKLKDGNLNNPKNRIQVPVFGDMTRLRHSIIHNRGIATSDISRCEVFRWFQKGDRISLDRDRIGEIIDSNRPKPLPIHQYLFHHHRLYAEFILL